MKIAESELIINPDGTIFHLHITPEQLADIVVLVGDPNRVAMFEPLFQTIEHKGSAREFVFITGLYKNVRMTVLSTGIGTDNIDIVMNELEALANFDFSTREFRKEHRRLTIVRVGTCGALQPEVPLGAKIVSAYSIGFDGLLNWYADREKVVDTDMEKCFMEHMNWLPTLPNPYFVKASDKLIGLFSKDTFTGMTISAPGFYGPQGRTVRVGLAMPDMIDRIESFRYGGMKINNFEMESSAIAGLAAHFGHDAITICMALAHRYHKGVGNSYNTSMSELAIYTLDNLSTLK